MKELTQLSATPFSITKIDALIALCRLELAVFWKNYMKQKQTLDFMHRIVPYYGAKVFYENPPLNIINSKNATI